MTALLSLTGQLTRLPVVSLAPVVVIRWVASRVLWDLTTHRIEVVLAGPADSCNRITAALRSDMNSSPMVRLSVLCFKFWERSSTRSSLCVHVYNNFENDLYVCK